MARRHRPDLCRRIGLLLHAGGDGDVYARADPSSVAPPRLVASPTLSFVLACAVAGVILFGLYPNPLVSFALQSVLTLK